jgi:hypothetical protein
MRMFSVVRTGVLAALLCALAGAPILAQGAAPPSVGQFEKRLLDDAKIAWSYFDRKGLPANKLPPANIWSVGPQTYDSYDILTMWDTGSIILATVSARSLGLIDEANFKTRIDTVLAFLKSATYTGGKLRLPNFRSKNDTAKSVQDGYDATDTGRLFIALNVLDKVTNGAFGVEKLIGGWTLGATIQNGVPHDIKEGVSAPAHSNIYRYYVSRGYSLWGVEHAAPYAGEDPAASESARDAFLDELGRIGPIATEPSLFEMIEVGGSAYSTVIADVLAKKQLARYEFTGRLTSVSETPIDRAPWFTYQGFDLTRQGEDAWTVYPYWTDEKWDTPEFAGAHRVVNTKAAILWYATRPSPYTEKVWAYVREHASSGRAGFHPGVYEQSGAPPKNIDVNTNAVVLAAIAFVMNGRQPLADVTFPMN